MRKIYILLAILITFGTMNTHCEEKSAGSSWTQRGDLWKMIPKTQWNIKIENKTQNDFDALLILQIIEEKDVNSTTTSIVNFFKNLFNMAPTPIVTLEAGPNSNQSAIKEINLPAMFHIQIERKQDKCKWDFAHGSLLNRWTEDLFFSRANNPKCGQASGVMTLLYNEENKTGELTFILTNIEDTQTQTIKELN